MVVLSCGMPWGSAWENLGHQALGYCSLTVWAPPPFRGHGSDAKIAKIAILAIFAKIRLAVDPYNVDLRGLSRISQEARRWPDCGCGVAFVALGDVG